MWIDTDLLIPTQQTDEDIESGSLTGVIVEIIPMLILLKELAKFEQKFFTNDSCEANADQWQKFNFIIGIFY